jgi:RNA polymerase sigma-70 factor (ECF subfamily)
MSIPFGTERKPDTEGAFELTESFCDRIAPQATRYAMSIVRVWADAEEVVQDAFCRLLDSDRCTQHSHQTLSEPKAILFTTVRNLSIDRLRKNGRRRFEAIDVSEIVTAKSTSESRLQKLENGIQEILKDLPSQWSDAIQLKVNGGLKYEEIAKVLNATHAQVRTWIYRARKQLEEDLNKKGLLERTTNE